MPTIATTLLLTLALLCPSLSAWATCPDSLCDCLGKVGTFSTFASGRLKAKTSKLSVSGSAYEVPMEIVGDSCATLAQIGGDADVQAETDSLVLLTPAPSVAVKFQSKKLYGVLDPGVFVHGDVVTAGGSIQGAGAVVIDGATDLSGTHPSLLRCQQAVTDLATAAATLGGLTATMTLGKVLAKGGSDDPTVIVAPPGITVATADKIQVKAARVDGYPDGSEIDIQTSSATEAFIINTTALKVGKLCTITADDPTKVIINVTGAGSRVGIDANATVDVAIVAKDRKITVGAQASTGNLYGIDVQVKGGSVAPTIECSPSGAFVDPDPNP